MNRSIHRNSECEMNDLEEQKNEQKIEHKIEHKIRDIFDADVENEIDKQLDAISENLTRLQGIASDIGTQIDVQNNMLDQVNLKADVVNDKFVSINGRIKLLVHKAGGCSFLIPCLILSAIVLALIGYILTIY